VTKHILPILFLLPLLASSLVVSTQLSITNSATIVPSLKYIVTILMENHPLNTTVDPNGVIGNANATFITSLAHQYGLAEHYEATSINGSLAQYIGLLSGNSSVVSSDCLPSVCPVAGPSVIDSIEASGRTWKAYMEDLPVDQSACGYTGFGSGEYNVYHDPFVYYTDIMNNATRCTNILPANSGPSTGAPDDIFLRDLNDPASAANFIWLSPDNCDDMHGNPSCPPSTITTADNYTAQLVPQILDSALFKTDEAALFIVWDEATYCGISCPIPAIWIGPTVKQGYVSNAHYNHYSYLKTIETLWNLPSLNTFDATASPMTEFLP